MLQRAEAGGLALAVQQRQFALAGRSDGAGADGAAGGFLAAQRSPRPTARKVRPVPTGGESSSTSASRVEDPASDIRRRARRVGYTAGNGDLAAGFARTTRRPGRSGAGGRTIGATAHAA